MREINELEKARNYAFLLLKYRPRSEKELSQRLKRKKFETGIIAEVIAFLKENSFIDDSSFARAWIESRINKPIGIKRLRQELKLKGIPQEIIDSRILAVKSGYNEEEVVGKLAREKYNKTKGIPPQAAKRRIFSYLTRRGFSVDSVINALKDL